MCDKYSKGSSIAGQFGNTSHHTPRPYATLCEPHTPARRRDQVWECTHWVPVGCGPHDFCKEFHLVLVMSWSIITAFRTGQSEERRYRDLPECCARRQWGWDYSGVCPDEVTVSSTPLKLAQTPPESIPEPIDIELTHMSCTITSLTTEPTRENP